MRSNLVILAGSVALAFATSASAGNHNGWYLGLEGGGNWVSDNDATLRTSLPTSGPARIDFDTGWAGIATAGYAFQNNWRLEGEFGYRHNDVNTINGASNGGELNTSSLMGNLLYDFPVSDRMTLSLGAGAGALHAEFDDGVLDQDEDIVFAYQGIAGVNYALSSRMDLTLNYRYLRTNTAEFQGQHVGHTDFYEADNFQNQTVTIGLRYDLYPDAVREAPMPAPMAEAPPPPPLAAPSAPRQFLVFFGFNKTVLTVEAQRVVADAAAAAKQYGSASLVVVGHADTVGSKQYNQQLSERRAATVRSALIGQGIETSKITASGHGETELLVQTDDNVKEPQNRRTSIELQ